ncbi:MAG: hypothetical protein GY927_05105 [bacterium]|nr:hypothetical protein [bacterium]
MEQSYVVGQAWSYNAPPGFERSRIIIGAILTFASHQPIICVAVTKAPMSDTNGDVQPLTIPFLPFSKIAFDQTVMTIDRSAQLPENFSNHYTSWKNDLKGLGFINTPFKDLLRSMNDKLFEKEKQMTHAMNNITYLNNH